MNDRPLVLAVVSLVALVTFACRGKAPAADAGTPAANTSATGPEGCRESSAVLAGSYETEDSYDHPDQPPTSKHKQSYKCRKSAVLAFHFEYPARADALTSCKEIGPKLWGGRTAPHGGLDDELLTKGASVVFLSGGAVEQLAKQLETDGWTRWRAPAAK